MLFFGYIGLSNFDFLVICEGQNWGTVLLCSSDVTRGLQSTARSMQMMETTVKQGANFVQATTTEKLIPAIRSKVPTARGKAHFQSTKHGQVSKISKHHMRSIQCIVISLQSLMKKTAGRVDTRLGKVETSVTTVSYLTIFWTCASLQFVVIQEIWSDIAFCWTRRVFYEDLTWHIEFNH